MFQCKMSAVTLNNVRLPNFWWSKFLALDKHQAYIQPPIPLYHKTCHQTNQIFHVDDI